MLSAVDSEVYTYTHAHAKNIQNPKILNHKEYGRIIASFSLKVLYKIFKKRKPVSHVML